MAEAVQVSGIASVWVNVGATLSSSSYTLLGYSQDGVRFRDEAFYTDVHGDEFGGQEGPPIEIQYLGKIQRVHLELTKYDDTVAAELGMRVRNATEDASHIGDLIFASSGYIPLKVVCGRLPQAAAKPLVIWKNLLTVFREPIEVNKGTKYSTLVLDATAYMPPTGWNGETRSGYGTATESLMVGFSTTSNSSTYTP